MSSFSFKRLILYRLTPSAGVDLYSSLDSLIRDLLGGGSVE